LLQRLNGIISEVKMKTISFNQEKTCTHYRIISALLVFLFFIAPLPALAEDAGIDALRQVSKAFAKIAEEASPAVVGIKAEKTITYERPNFRDSPFGDSFDDDILDRFFRRYSPRRRAPQQRKYQQMAQGSGIIVSDDGYILTNNHLVGDVEKVTVKLADDRDCYRQSLPSQTNRDCRYRKCQRKKRFPSRRV
jgi:serine protease Do